MSAHRPGRRPWTAVLDRSIAVALLVVASALALGAPVVALPIAMTCDVGCGALADPGFLLLAHGPIAAVLFAVPLVVLHAVRGGRIWWAAALSTALVVGLAAGGAGLILAAAA